MARPRADRSGARRRGLEIQAAALDLFRRTYGVLARPDDRLVEWSECLAHVAIELPVTAVRATVIAAKGRPSDGLILGRRVILWDAGPSGRNDRALAAKGALPQLTASA